MSSNGEPFGCGYWLHSDLQLVEHAIITFYILRGVDLVEGV